MFDNDQAAINMFREANKKGDFCNACRIIDQALLEFPECAVLWAFASELYTLRNRRDEAHQALARAKELAPESGITWAADAALADFEARFDDALYAIKKAMEIDERDPWILEKAVSVYLTASDNIESAVSITDGWRKLYPNDVQAYQLSITALLSAGRESEAKDMLQQAEEHFSDEPTLCKSKAWLLLRAGKLVEAAEILEASIAKSDGSYELWGQYANTLESCGRLGEAEAAAKRALEISPCAIQAMSAMSRICRRRGNEKKAIEWRKKAQEAIPALSLQMKLQNANAAIRKGELDDCLKICDEVLVAPSQMIKKSALNIKARVLLMKDELDEAESAIAIYATMDPESKYIYEFKGNLFRKQMKFQESRAILLDGIARFPEVASLRSNLILTLHDMGAREEEAKLVDVILEFRPQTPYGYIGLVTALDATGHEAEARELRNAGLEMFPNTQELKLYSAVDRLAIGDTKVAKKIASAVSGELHPLAQTIDKGASRIERIQRLIEFIKSKRNNGKPPTLN